MILIRVWFSFAPFTAVAVNHESKPICASGWTKSQAESRLLKLMGIIA